MGEKRRFGCIWLSLRCCKKREKRAAKVVSETPVKENAAVLQPEKKGITGKEQRKAKVAERKKEKENKGGGTPM